MPLPNPPPTRVFFVLLAVLLVARAFADPLDGATLRVGSAEYKLVAQPADAPAAVLELTGQAPLSVHLDLARLAPDVPWADARAARFTFAPNVQLVGGNAAHVYDEPGLYDARVDVVGRALVVRVTVTPDARRRVHLAADGDDARDGAAPDRAVRTWRRAADLVGDGAHAALLLRRGDQFDADRSLNLTGDDTLVGSYGTAGDRPVVRATASPVVIVSGDRATVQDVAFDSPAIGTDKGGAPDAVHLAGGAGHAVRRCAFLNVSTAVLGNGRPDGALVEACVAPLPTGVKSYFAWCEGRAWTLVNNTAINSTREHVVRANVAGVDGVLIAGNRFANLDRRPDGDPWDFAKGVVNLQVGSRAVVRGNVLVGPSSVGPLGGGDGMPYKATRFRDALFAHNRVVGRIEVKHGAERVELAGNHLAPTGGPAVSVDGRSGEYARAVVDLVLRRNTARVDGTDGAFVSAGSLDGLKLIENRLVAPKFRPGSNLTAAVYLEGRDPAASLAESRGNLWPDASARGLGYAEGGVMYAWPQWSDPRGYLTPAEWAALPAVSGDRFTDAPTPDAGCDEGALPEAWRP